MKLHNMGHRGGIRPITSSNTRQWSRIHHAPQTKISFFLHHRLKDEKKLWDKSTKEFKQKLPIGFLNSSILTNEMIQLRLNKGKVEEGKVELTVLEAKKFQIWIFLIKPSKSLFLVEILTDFSSIWFQTENVQNQTKIGPNFEEIKIKIRPNVTTSPNSSTKIQTNNLTFDRYTYL